MEPALLPRASRPSSASRMKRTPVISRTWRGVSSGRRLRFAREDRERADDARLAPEEGRELRVGVRRILRAGEPAKPILHPACWASRTRVRARAILSPWL